jgi:hypothetical protein
VGQLLRHLVFDSLFKQPYVIIRIRQHALGAIRDDGCPANLDSIHDIKRAIDQGHRGCGAFVVLDPRRRKPKLPSFWIDSSLLVSGTSRYSKFKCTAKLASDYISRRGDAVDGYVGLVGLTECCGGQQDSERQAFVLHYQMLAGIVPRICPK